MSRISSWPWTPSDELLDCGDLGAHEVTFMAWIDVESFSTVSNCDDVTISNVSVRLVFGKGDTLTVTEVDVTKQLESNPYWKARISDAWNKAHNNRDNYEEEHAS